MSPRSLLFTSDPETARLLSQALRELNLNPEACSEIFAALRSLTARSYDLIAVDWDEGPEASFALKTARDLKSNRGAFVIVLGKIEASAALYHAGADLVLGKPIVAASVRHTLLTSPDFVARMKAWLPDEARDAENPPPAVDSWAAPLAQPSAKAQVATLRSPAYEEDDVVDAPVPTLAFATLDGGSGSGLLQRIFQRRSAAESNPSPTLRGKNFARSSMLLQVAAIGVAFFAVGYVFSHPLSVAGRSAAAVSRAAWSQAQNWWSGSSMAEVQAADVQPLPISSELDDDPPEVGSPAKSTGSSARVHVAPARSGFAERETALIAIQPQTPDAQPNASAPAPSPAQPSPTSVSAEAASAPTPVRHIPENLSSPFPGAATVRTVAAKITPALLDALEPISLPEQLSEKLLLDKVEPSYPQRALQAGLQGPVILEAWIGKDGRIRDLKLVRGSLLLGQAACDAVRQWRYKPYLLNGQAVEAQTLVTVDFKLP